MGKKDNRVHTELQKQINVYKNRYILSNQLDGDLDRLLYDVAMAAGLDGGRQVEKLLEGFLRPEIKLINKQDGAKDD